MSAWREDAVAPDVGPVPREGALPERAARRKASPAPRAPGLVAISGADPLPPDIAFLTDFGYAPSVLGEVARVAREAGRPAADILLAWKLIGPTPYYRALAAALGVRFLGHADLVPDPRLAPSLAGVDPRRLSVLALASPGRGMVIAMAPPPAVVADVFARVRRDPAIAAGLRITTPESLRRAAAIHAAVDGLAVARPDYSARAVRLLSDAGSTVRAGGLFLILGTVAVLAPGVMMALAGVLFLIGSLARLAAAVHDGRDHPLRRGHLPGNARWPRYSILVPLYREAAVVPDLVAALGRLDYPRARLDIKLIVEEDDAETRAALSRLAPGRPFDILLVPNLGPRTKPKALAYALRFADGDLVTVYDAEDRPDPDQLRKVARLFASAPLSVGCVQARLAVDHAHETFFTRQFALEYATLFDLLLPWMSSHHLLLPLGGTSNHFRRRALEDCGGWDPYNVTEDVDIGIRLVRDGWRIVTVDSTTWEEAPLDFPAWLGQRVRWHKGWLQTWLVHMARPRQLLRDLGIMNFVVTVLLFAGTALALVAHPAFLVMVLSYVLDASLLPRVRGLADVTVIGAGTACLLAGYGASFFAMVRAARKRGLPIRATDWLGLPLYWLLMSAAFVIAVWELIRRPNHWRKTRHGVARQRRTPIRRKR